jgi:hypothetical protein
MSVILALLSAAELFDELRGADIAERSGAVLVRLRPGDPVPPLGLADRLASLPFVVVGVSEDGTADGNWRPLCDVVVAEGEPALEQITANVEACPQACTSLALLLRGQLHRSIGEGLIAESATYSTLQSGPEFASWRASRPPRTDSSADDNRPRVNAERDHDLLRVTLTRSARLNALDKRMRDELLDALRVAAADPTITNVELHGEGRAFCAGGDLDEFGSRPDPATAHLIRLQRSIGRAVWDLRDRITVQVHGATMGSGIELAAFAGTVLAHEDTTIALPEVRLGLVPGAGGTVSLPRRIGRLRTAWLAFSGMSIDAQTARSWGLIDTIVP